MATTITENLQGTRAGSIDAAGSRTLQRQFTVATDGGEDLQAVIAAMDAHIAPMSTYEVGTHTATGAAVEATYWGTKSWSRPEGTTDTWSFTLNYSTAPSAGGGATGEDAVLTTQGDTRATTKAVYRKDPDTDNVDNPDPATDIGGESIDEGGTPTSITAIDRRFSTTEQMLVFPNIGMYSALAGKRNQGSYEGGDAGTILYLGFSWSYDTSSGLWSVSHQFAVDTKTHHAEQVAKTDPQGDVVKVRENIGDVELSFASHVFWVQPFEKASFKDLPEFSV